ncbi:tyrosinase tyrosinase: common central domain protein [Rhizoctonia solani 123E]|uniref:Tyrosinase tyrosinase: common central domain protein n=1 Tax=Rhizoctonia solani 123E TaxID=1423351 RepID=A0A074RXC0_9AGAM|nr:tyrosinase tyrosinase: common central domain protein [Rhizoctonia solani 123E]
MRASVLALSLFGVVTVSASSGDRLSKHQEPVANCRPVCANPAIRKEWRDLDRTTQQNYISAVKCLTTKPARINNYPGATLYDDFATVHMSVFKRIHFVAQFFPWHRWFVHLYETALKDCGYDGNAIYWDWTRASRLSLMFSDAGLHVVDSPIFDPVTGFGGTGTNVTKPSPIATGPFANFTVVAYSDYSGHKDYGRPHYLERQFTSQVVRNNTIIPIPANEDGSMLSERYNESEMNSIMDNGKNFEMFREPFEGIPHQAIHDTIGGDMSPSNSPNHHTNVDRWWWKWQRLNNSVNALQYTGNTVQGSRVQDATAQDLMPFMGLLGGEDLPVSDVLLTSTLKLCYTYDY